MCLPKFDIKQSTVALNCFKSCETLDVLTFSKKQNKTKHCLMFGLKFTLFDVTSFLSDNLLELKKFIFKPENHWRYFPKNFPNILCLLFSSVTLSS